MIVFPEEEGPNFFDRSTLIVRVFPSTVISTFFISYVIGLLKFLKGFSVIAYQTQLQTKVKDGVSDAGYGFKFSPFVSR